MCVDHLFVELTRWMLRADVENWKSSFARSRKCDCATRQRRSFKRVALAFQKAKVRKTNLSHKALKKSQGEKVRCIFCKLTQAKQMDDNPESHSPWSIVVQSVGAE
ncbi:unnamed protein product [Durusdinium trenchii]|uniref:Uncharacterized protein n=1 Tax=Durusdinium trenchii TaxID=1381693 RepID=A0ABP0QBI5_9DINO